MHTPFGIDYQILHGNTNTYGEGCLLAVAIECAAAKCMLTGLISGARKGSNPGRGTKLGKARMP